MTEMTVPQTHWINGTIPAAVPSGMEHAILILDSNAAIVDTLALMLTKSAHPPAVEQIAPGETPIQIPATNAEMEFAARYEQNIRELVEWTDAVDQTPHLVDTIRTQSAQIQTDSADQNRTTRDSLVARAPLIFRGATAQPA